MTAAKPVARPLARSGGRGRPSKAKGLDLKETILDAAEGLFARHGFYGVTTRQVAAEAGVDTALIHYYFGAKRELFDAVFVRRAEILNQARGASMDLYVQTHARTMTVEGSTAVICEAAALSTSIRPASCRWPPTSTAPVAT